MYDGEPVKKVIGVVFHPEELLRKHLVRFLQRQVMEGKPLPPGNYKAVAKTGDDGSRHNWFKWAKGTFCNCPGHLLFLLWHNNV